MFESDIGFQAIMLSVVPAIQFTRYSIRNKGSWFRIPDSIYSVINSIKTAPVVSINSRSFHKLLGIIFVKVKGKVVPLYATEALWVTGGIAPTLS
jgi:hypothetical protein